MKRLAIVLALAACSPTPFVVTGNAIDLAGEQFITTAKLFDQGLDSGQIDARQYKVWAAFGLRFQASYPLAVKTWKDARATADLVAEQKAAEAIGQLVGELGEYFKLVNDVLHPGAP